MDYPFREAIASALPICDAFYVSVGQSEDETYEALRAWQDSRLVVLRSEWDLHHRRGGEVLARETNKLMRQLPPADWLLYLQADEVLHEEDYPKLREATQRYGSDSQVEGIVLRYLHFYGDYEWIAVSRKWYRREVRIIRPWEGIHSYRDAQGFRRYGRKIRAQLVDARVFHYGWVRPPEKQQEKIRRLHYYWHDDAWIVRHTAQTFSYRTDELLERFTGTHPAVMQNRIQRTHWRFEYDPASVSLPWSERFLHWIEKRTGWRPGEFRNYQLLST
ncbi:MAG: glycosyltransferase family 2 protein [Bacteroidia bacterium]|nr:glycosyltransferase family 2 protein [Bacteroidia bacterium]